MTPWFASCVILAKLLNLPAPCFHIIKQEQQQCLFCRVVVRVNEIILIKHLALSLAQSNVKGCGNSYYDALTPGVCRVIQRNRIRESMIHICVYV